MRRVHVVTLLGVVVMGTLLSGGRTLAVAQEGVRASHPAVGAWIVDADPEDPLNALGLAILTADGTAIGTTGEGTTAIGVWAPTSDTTADVTFTGVTNGPAYVTVRASVQVASDKQSFTGTFTTESVFDPAHGGTSGEIGPGAVEGTRMPVQGPGTPVASFAEFFPQPNGTPEATPVP